MGDKVLGGRGDCTDWTLVDLFGIILNEPKGGWEPLLKIITRRILLLRTILYYFLSNMILNYKIFLHQILVDYVQF